MRLPRFVRHIIDGRPFEHMTLRKKTLLIVVIAQFLCFASFNTFMGVYFNQQLDKIEQDQATHQAQQVQGQIEQEFNFLAAKLGDYSGWDATYKFIQDHNQAYLKNDLGESMLVMGVHLMAFVDDKGNIVWAQGADTIKRKLVPPPKSITKKFLLANPYFSHFTHKKDQAKNGKESHLEDQAQGIISLPEGVLLLVSRPILRTDYTGPPRGYMLAGQWLSKETVGKISKLTRLTLSLKSIDDLSDAELQHAIMVETPLPNQIIVTTLFKDIYGKPAASIMMTAQRPINAQARKAAVLGIGGSFLAMFIMIAMTLWIVDRMVLLRVSRLRTLINRIHASNDLTARVFLSGADELSDLAQSMNNMLGSLEKAQTQQDVMHGKLLQASRVASVGALMSGLMHEINNPLMIIKGNLELLERSDPLLIENSKTQKFIKNQDKAINAIIDTTRKFKKILQPECATTEHFNIGGTIEQALLVVERGYAVEGVSLLRAFYAPQTIAHGNVNKFQQMILNLLSNAYKSLKNRASKKITVHTEMENDYFVIKMIDTGCGMEKDHVSMLLDPPTLLARATSGNGIGLAIVYDIVQELKGSITCASLPQEGSVFTVRIPLAMAKAA